MLRDSRWYLIPLVAALAAAPARRVDAQSISFGQMAGGSLSTCTGDFAADVKQYAGFIAGGFVHIGLAGFAVQPGIHYTTKGVRSEQFYGTVNNINVGTHTLSAVAEIRFCHADTRFAA